LATLSWLVARRQVVRRRELLLGLLGLNAALQLVSWLSQPSSAGIVAGHAPFAFLGTVLIELAFLWDLFLSGKEVTNQGNAAFPRSARVLLYLGYTVLLTASAMYIASETFDVSGAHVPSYVDASVFSGAGLVVLGISLLVTLFLVGASTTGDKPHSGTT
jgi:hypothetical protein